MNAAVMAKDDSLLAALGRPAGDAPGTIPGLRLTTHWAGLTDALGTLWAATGKDSDAPASQGQLALDARRNRRPLELARVLAAQYGHALDPVNYTQGVGISGRLRLAALDDGSVNPAAEIAELIAPIAADPPAFLAEAGGAALAGVVWAARLADYTGDEAYRRLFFYAADRFVARGEGQAPAPCDPDFRVEDMFYVGAMLGRACRISGDVKYADMMARFLIDGGDVQDSSGLFKHARSAPLFLEPGQRLRGAGLRRSPDLPAGGTSGPPGVAAAPSPTSGRAAASPAALGNFWRVGGCAGSVGRVDLHLHGGLRAGSWVANGMADG